VAVEHADDSFFGVLSERKQRVMRELMRELIQAPG